MYKTTGTVLAFYYDKYGDLEKAYESASSVINSFFIHVETFFTKAGAVLRKLVLNFRRIGTYYLPKSLSQIAPSLHQKINDVYRELRTDSLRMDHGQDINLDQYRYDLKDILDSTDYTNFMTANVENYKDEESVKVDSNAIVKKMQKVIDSITEVKTEIIKDKRDPNLPQKRMEMWSLCMQILSEYMKVLARMFKFGKIKSAQNNSNASSDDSEDGGFDAEIITDDDFRQMARDNAKKTQKS